MGVSLDLCLIIDIIVSWQNESMNGYILNPISIVFSLKKSSKLLGELAKVTAITFPFSSPIAAGYGGLP